MDDDPADEDVDFEVQLEVVDVGSFALAVVSLASNALASDSMPVATSLGNVVYGSQQIIYFTPPLLIFDLKGGKCCVFPNETTRPLFVDF